MNRLAVFILFFILAWFVPTWPVLLVIGVVWLIAKFQSAWDKEPPPALCGPDLRQGEGALIYLER
jgi:hypothetical protein